MFKYKNLFLNAPLLEISEIILFKSLQSFIFLLSTENIMLSCSYARQNKVILILCLVPDGEDSDNSQVEDPEKMTGWFNYLTWHVFVVALFCPVVLTCCSSACALFKSNFFLFLFHCTSLLFQ